jgi:hypothetical protein
MERVGAGAFLRHGKERFCVEIAGRDVVSEALDPMALSEAMTEGLTAQEGISDGLSVKGISRALTRHSERNSEPASRALTVTTDEP